jgi:hypothetical protein
MLSNDTTSNLAKLIFQAVDWANVADDTATSPLTNLYWRLHTALPGLAGNQETSMATYTNFAPVATARTAGGFSVSAGGIVTPAAAVVFPTSSASGNNEYCPVWSIGKTVSGTDPIICQGVIIKPTTKATPCVGATTNTITAPAHGGAVDDRVMFFQSSNVSLPGGLSEGTVYWIVSTPTADTLTVSTSQGGAAVTITSSGAAIMCVLSGFQVTNEYTPRLTTATSLIIR